MEFQRIKKYFYFQFIRTNRQLDDFGVSPWIAYVLGGLLFFAFCEYIFSLTTNWDKILVITFLYLIYYFSNPQKEMFLTQYLKKSECRWIICIENILIASPFGFYFLLKGKFLFALLLIIIAFIVLFLPRDYFSKSSIYSPFSKKPYEFPIGFRMFLIFFVVTFITYFIGLSVENYNLSFVSILAMHFFILSFYSTQDKAEYIWLFSSTPRGFLSHKILTAVLYCFLLTISLLLLLIYLSVERQSVFISIYFLSFFYIILAILIRYATHPKEIPLPFVFIFLLSVIFPPLLLVLIPLYYSSARKKIKPILE